MLDPRQLLAFSTVLEEGSFEKAAQRLGLTQSAVSQRLQRLESQLGQVLLVRGQPLEPTEAGRRLLAHAKQLALLEGDLLRDLGGDEASDRPTLTLGVNADTLAIWFLDALTAFLEEQEIILKIEVDDQEHTLDLLRRGEVIGCVAAKETPVQGCRAHYLGLNRYHCLAHPAFAARWFPEGLTRETVTDAPAVLFNAKDSTHDRLLEELFDLQGRPYPYHLVPNSERFVDFLLMGQGYGMAPDLQALPEIKSGSLVDLSPGRTIDVPLYWHVWGGQSQLTTTLTRTLVTACRKLLAQR
ncbi:LysR family transcriptional regulator ArgP [Rhodovibrionaceae bacterium A322]